MKKTIFLLFFILSSFFVKADVPTAEKDALIAFYNATNGANWINNTNWNTTEPVDSWYGITVNHIDGADHVVVLDFDSANNLVGTIPADLGVLNYIFFFRLKMNPELTGEIPSEIGNISSLQYLNLTNNKLSGSIPSSFTGLSNLSILYVYNNELSGNIPDFTTLSSLTRLTINKNNFVFADFENQFNDYDTTLEGFFYKPMNKVETEIHHDIVFGEDYTMTIPVILGTGVTYQWYKNNEPITGESGLSYTITNAQEEDGGNYTCKASSPIITDLEITRATIRLYGTISEIDRNALIAIYNATDGPSWTDNTNWNTAAPLYEWDGVYVTGSRVSSLILDDNNLIGFLPSQVGNLSDIQNLVLSHNQISGTLPVELGLLNNLTRMEFDFNEFSGNIPVEFGNLSQITRLNFWHNQLSGTLPEEIGNCTNLIQLVFEDNNITGEIPSSYANLTAMKYLWLNNNQLSGTVPNIFENMADLYFVALNNNPIIGDIDFSVNTNLRGVWLNDTNINSLDIRNGANSNMFYFYANNAPNLTCIFVDNATYCTTSWVHVDDTSTFVETQAACDVLAVKELQLLSDRVQLFPNPTSNIVYINNPEQIIISSIKVFNSLGQQTLNSINSNNSIDLSILDSGLYSIQIIDNQGKVASFIISKI